MDQKIDPIERESNRLIFSLIAGIDGTGCAVRSIRWDIDDDLNPIIEITVEPPKRD